MIAVYNENGAMITSKNAIIFDGKAQIGVSDKVYQTADRVKMFVLDINTYRPVTDVREFEV